MEMHWRGGVGVDVVGIGCKMGVPRLALQPVPPCAEHRDRQVTCLRSERLVRGLASVMGLGGKEDQALSLLLGITLVLCRVSSASCIPVPLPWLAVCCPVLVRQPGSSLTRSRTRNEAAGQDDPSQQLRSLVEGCGVSSNHCRFPLPGPLDALRWLQSPGHLPSWEEAPFVTNIAYSACHLCPELSVLSWHGAVAVLKCVIP